MMMQPTTVKAITLRNLPDRVAKSILKRATERGVSLNQAVISLLEEAVDPSQPRPAPRGEDFEEFAGLWSDEEADAFNRELERMRTIDEDLWQQ